MAGEGRKERAMARHGWRRIAVRCGTVALGVLAGAAGNAQEPTAQLPGWPPTTPVEVPSAAGSPATPGVPPSPSGGTGTPCHVTQERCLTACPTCGHYFCLGL